MKENKYIYITWLWYGTHIDIYMDVMYYVSQPHFTSQKKKTKSTIKFWRKIVFYGIYKSISRCII